MPTLTILALFCGIASLVATILVLAACMVSARISHTEGMAEDHKPSKRNGSYMTPETIS